MNPSFVSALQEVQRDQDTVQEQFWAREAPSVKSSCPFPVHWEDQMIRLALQKALDGQCRPDEAFGVSKVHGLNEGNFQSQQQIETQKGAASCIQCDRC